MPHRTRLGRLDWAYPIGLVVTASIHDYDHVACPSIATTGIASGTGVSTDGSIIFGAIPAQTSTMSRKTRKHPHPPAQKQSDGNG